MKYIGAKTKIAKDIVPIIQSYIDNSNKTDYIEPFVGGANIIDKVNCYCKIGFDINEYLIALLAEAKQDPELKFLPKECSFEHYKEVRDSYNKKDGKFTKCYIGGIGFLASYGGRFFDGGYGRDSKGGRSIYSERKANLQLQARTTGFLSSCFFCADFEKTLTKTFNNIKNSVIYCDIPYRNTKKYNNKDFDYDKFYELVIKLSKDNYVFISEYSMPEEFECIWQKEVSVLQKSDRKKGDRATEKLFVVKGGLR
jgi:DNA adenine methylase